MTSITNVGNKVRLKFLLLLVFAFLAFQSVSTPVSALNMDFSVSQGQSFNFDVVKGPTTSGFRSRSFTGTGGFTGGFPFTRTGTGTAGSFGGFGGFGNFLDINNNDFNLRPQIRVPATGTIYQVILTQLPTNNTEGSLEYDIPGQSSTPVSSYHGYGSPVISTDWAGWNSELNTIITSIKALSNVKDASLSIATDSATELKTSITIDVNPPTFTNSTTSTSGFNFQISNIVMTQIVTYQKSNGLRVSYTLITQFTTQNGQQSSTTEIDYTTASTRIAPSGSNSNDMLLFVGVVGVIVLPLGAIVVYRYKNRNISQAEVIKKSSIKQKALVDDLKLRLQNSKNPTKSKEIKISPTDELKLRLQNAETTKASNTDLPGNMTNPLTSIRSNSPMSNPPKIAGEPSKTKFKSRRR